MGGDHGRRLNRRERSEIRARIAAGETHWEAAEAVDCSTKTVQRLLVKTGGLPPGPVRALRFASRWPSGRKSREGCGPGSSAGRSPEGWGRAPSTVSREVTAHGSREGYRAWRADEQAVRAARRPKIPKLARHPRLRVEVERRLAQRWSPEQISRRLAAGLSRRPRDACVARDDLPIAVRPGPRRPAQGADEIPAFGTHPALRSRTSGRSRPSPGHGLHLRASGSRTGSGGAGALGGRFDDGASRPVLHRDPG